MNIDQEVLDFIIYLIKSHKENLKKDNLQDYSVKGSAKYLLSQTIRQMYIPYENMYVSEGALALWQEYISDDIKTKSYRDSITCKKDWTNRPKYTGAKKTYETIEKTPAGSSFAFNEVFHDEHIIPVSDIINILLDLPLEDNNSDYEKVKAVLKNLCVCKILKSENIELNKVGKYKRKDNERYLSVDEILSNLYKKAKINKVYKYSEIDSL